MKYYFLLLLLILIIAVFKILNVHPTFSDENVYFLMAKKVLEGKVPYKDFNFVHPPLQLYAISAFFKIFGISILSGKLLPILFSSFSAILVFEIGRKIFKKEEKAFLATLFFLLFPPFLIYGDQELGIWESIFFMLLSLNFLLSNNYFLSSLFFSFSFFFRYLSILFLPLFLILTENRKKYIFFSFIFLLLGFFLFTTIFGDNFFKQTLKYQIESKLFINTKLKKDYWQYFSFGIFTLTILILTFFISLSKRNNFFFAISFYSLLYEILLVLSLKTIAYHYFLYTIPFVSLCYSYTFFARKGKFSKIFLSLLLILSIVSSISTFDFYFNKERSKYIEEIATYISSKISKEDKIFGESTLTDYIAFSKNVEIANNYLDAYVDYLRYISEDKVLENLEKEKPKYIIEMNAYLTLYPKFAKYINENYVLEKVFEEKKSGIVYFLYKRIY